MPEPTLLQWARTRMWLMEKIERTSGGLDEDYYRGYNMALQKVFARHFLTESEEREVERAREEMFG